MAEPVGGTLSREFRRLYEDAGLNQSQVAALLGVPQSTVSEWARGTAVPKVTLFRVLEEFCGVTVGTILRRAGYVQDDPADLEAAINAHPHIDVRTKRIMVNIYRDSMGEGVVSAPSTLQSRPKVPIQSST